MTKAKTVAIRLTPADIRAIHVVLDMAIENSCSCAESDEKGYLDHDTSCWVHLCRAYLKRVQAIINRAKATQ